MLIETKHQGVIYNYGVQYIHNYKVVHWAVRQDHKFTVTEKTDNNFHCNVYGNMEIFESKEEVQNYIGNRATG